MADKGKELALTGGQELTFGASMQIDKGDLVAYQVAQVEEKLLEREKELNKEIEKLSKDVKQKRDDIQRELMPAVEKAVSIQMKKIHDAFKTLGIQAPEKQICISRAQLNGDEDKIVYAIGGVHCDDDELKPIAIPASIQARHKVYKQTAAALSEAIEKIDVVRDHLRNISRHERKARAKIIETVLGKTSEGKAILAQLQAPDLKI